jgi:hypothetical protein
VGSFCWKDCQVGCQDHHHYSCWGFMWTWWKVKSGSLKILSETVSLQVFNTTESSWKCSKVRVVKKSEWQSCQHWSCVEYQSFDVRKHWSCQKVSFPNKVIGSERWCSLSLCAVPSQPFFVSISWGIIKSELS